jgi:hypothetical protein
MNVIQKKAKNKRNTTKRNPNPQQTKQAKTNKLRMAYKKAIKINTNRRTTGQGILSKQDTTQTNYLRSLLYPEIAHDARISSPYPQETATFHRHITLRSATNALGNAAVIYQPWALYDTSHQTLGTMFINNAATLTLTTPETTTGYSGSFIPYALPPNTYSSYRLVSASLQLLSNQPNLTATGIAGGGIVSYGSQAGYGALGAGNFLFNGDQTVQANVDQAMFFKQANLQKSEQLRCIYYPFDATYTMFVSTNNFREVALAAATSTFFMTFYISNATASSPFTMELDLNFECLIYPVAKGYITTAFNEDTTDPGKAAHFLVRNDNSVTQVSGKMQEYVEERENKWLTLLTDVGSTAGKLAMKWLPQLFV